MMHDVYNKVKTSVNCLYLCHVRYGATESKYRDSNGQNLQSKKCSFLTDMT